MSVEERLEDLEKRVADLERESRSRPWRKDCVNPQDIQGYSRKFYEEWQRSFSRSNAIAAKLSKVEEKDHGKTPMPIEIENDDWKNLSVVAKGIQYKVIGVEAMLDKMTELKETLERAKVLVNEIADSKVEVIKTKL